jgi:hypothetical protein
MSRHFGISNPAALQVSQSLNLIRPGRVPAFVSATGGIVTEINVGEKRYRVHTFTGNGTLTVETPGEIEYLIVGAGGAGAGSTGNGAGGNGGQMITGSANKEAQSYNVVVGASTGATSSLFGVSATGGATGRAGDVTVGVGASGGMDGLPTTIRGAQEYFAGGGGNGGGFGPGLGGGGAGGLGASGGVGNPGTPNTGGGGGGGRGIGAWGAAAGGAGGSGIVIVRYEIQQII